MTEIYTKLRATSEHSIEEILFAGVIGRFRPEVAIQRLRAAHVDKDDYKAVRAGMTRCSKFSGHDIALEVPPDLPKFDDIKQDFEALRGVSWPQTPAVKSLIKKATNKRKSRSRQKSYSRKVSHSVSMLARGIVLYGVQSFNPFPVDFESSLLILC